MNGGKLPNGVNYYRGWITRVCQIAVLEMFPSKLIVTQSATSVTLRRPIKEV